MELEILTTTTVDMEFAKQMETIPVTVGQQQHQHPLEEACGATTACSRVCSFTIEEQSDTFQKRSRSITKLGGLIAFYLIAMAVEIIGGKRANSLAVLTDAAHLLVDVAGFSVSLFAIWASGWKPNPKHSYGYHRLEVLGALISVQLIWVVTGFMIYEAVDRILRRSSIIDGRMMFIVAAFGFVINIVMVFWLGDSHGHFHHHHDHNHEPKSHHHHQDQGSAQDCDKLITTKSEMVVNINIEGAYLHVIADLIQSAGVMIAGAVIWVKPTWLLIDLITTIVFSIIVLASTFPMLGRVFGVVMEGAPEEVINAKVGLESGLRCVNGVREIHDLHVWSITVGKVAMSCHVVAENGVKSGDIVAGVREYCIREYGISHVTVQVEEE